MLGSKAESWALSSCGAVEGPGAGPEGWGPTTPHVKTHIDV